ncbi:hypothetical protein PIB30_084596 [Stylosanthes scabra]|uniref:Uncharacterized protein n=1 Tax=Stylosanthes scabra TaxID=79078 RepID=A0ABU6QUZ5_9FABA|nr:hypothetical protein [Stylosanthes scabra]
MPNFEPPREIYNRVDELLLDDVPDLGLALPSGKLNDLIPLQGEDVITAVWMTASPPWEWIVTEAKEPIGDIKRPEDGMQPHPLTVIRRSQVGSSSETMVYLPAGGLDLKLFRDKGIILERVHHKH